MTSKQPFYIPKNPEKYIGDVTKICVRSSWERAVMRYLDMSTAIEKWSSEEIVIPYFDKGTKQSRRYFPDFLVQVKYGDDSSKTILIEVKPYYQTIPPVPPKRKTTKSQNRLIEEHATYATNVSKWEAARDYCTKKGWEFMILTEREIYGKK